MKRAVVVSNVFIVLLVAAFHVWAAPVVGRNVSVTWGGNADFVYDTGFMHKLMKSPDGGVTLFNMDLVNNDAPGAGFSEKGVSSDVIWGKIKARKILNLDDPRAKKAWLVVFTANAWGNGSTKYPLKFTVNGNAGALPSWDPKKSSETYRWTDFPASWLKKGANVIELSCPEAQTEQEGWIIYIARADEFEEGGGDPRDVGKTSFKSADGGETWKESPFGPLGQTRAEYSVRLSFDRFVKAGWLATPVIDLWKGDAPDVIVPFRTIKKLKISIKADVPVGTTVSYFIRKGTAPGPFSGEWSAYEPIGGGASVEQEINGDAFSRRYMQLRAVLTTDNLLLAPTIKSFQVSAEHYENHPLHPNIYIVDVYNPPIRYSSIPWEWEPWDRPEFQKLKIRENLDRRIAGSQTEFDAQVKLLDYAATRCYRSPGTPIPEHPGWDALSILDRIDKTGTVGMCIQYNNLLGGLHIAYGWQARLVNIIGHEVCEVWNDEFGKWVYMDASYVNHYVCDEKTGIPLDMLELHNRYLDSFYPDRPIDWMNDMIGQKKMSPDQHVRRGSLSFHEPIDHNGLTLAASMRMVPRNNWYEKPYPRPLSHGVFWWPWDGYINWYDSRTPPRRQYSWFTDRPRDMWPDINTVHVDITSSFNNRELFLRFETYTPNLGHFEVNENETGWKQTDERWTWFLQSGRNTLLVRSVSKLGVKGKPSTFVINHVDAPLDEHIQESLKKR
jgi:hypothetical protein